MRAKNGSPEAAEHAADNYADRVLDTCRWFEQQNVIRFGVHELPVVLDQGSVAGRRLGQASVVAEDFLDWEPVAMANLIEAASRADIVKRGLKESQRQAVRGMNDGGSEFTQHTWIRQHVDRKARDRREAEDYLRQNRIRTWEQRLEELDRRRSRLASHLAEQREMARISEQAPPEGEA